MPPRLGLTAVACCRLLVHSLHIMSAGTSPDSTPRCSPRNTCTNVSHDRVTVAHYPARGLQMIRPCPKPGMAEVAFGSVNYTAVLSAISIRGVHIPANCSAALAAILLPQPLHAMMLLLQRLTKALLSQSHLGTELRLQLQELPPSLQDSPLLVAPVVC
jgi:hypothetical protein